MSGILRARSCLLLMILAVSPPPAAVIAGNFFEGVDGYRFIIPEVTADPGDSIDIDVLGAHEQSAQGFSIALRFPAQDLTIGRVHMRDSILEAIDTDFLDVEVDPLEGVLTIGVLVDAQPPFTGAVIPSIDRTLRFLTIEATVSSSVPENTDLVLRFEDGLRAGPSSPPISNLFVVDNESQFVTELGEGLVRVAAEQPMFLRGDINGDAQLDVSDPIKVLRYQFNGDATPGCMDAGDANDDAIVDISDAIYLLAYLFQGSRPPPLPRVLPGADPTEDDLDCVQPLLFGHP